MKAQGVCGGWGQSIPSSGLRHFGAGIHHYATSVRLKARIHLMESLRLLLFGEASALQLGPCS